MSLDVDLMVTKPCSVYEGNITHNLGKMAGQVLLTNGMSLYDVLWRPDEHGLTHAGQIVDSLHEGIVKLTKDPDYFKKYNPENGWGSYEGLVNFTRDYYNACMENMEAELRISR
jgi:hypothetical protein